MDQDHKESQATLPEVTVTEKIVPPRGQASKPPEASAIDIILSPGSTFGRYLAQSGMSAESAKIANQMGDIKERAKGKTLGECLHERVMQATADAKAPPCSPDKDAVMEELAGNAASRVFKLVKGTAGHVLSEVFDTVASGLQVENNHKDAIRMLAQNQYPGMAYNEEIIGSIKVTTWADAIGAGLYPDDPKFKTYNKVESLNGAHDEADRFSREQHRKIDQLVARTESSALESAQNYIGENGYDEFRNHLGKAGKIMQTQYTKEQGLASEYKQSIMPVAQDRMRFAEP